MIRFEQVGKRYPGGKDALAELSFEVADGEFVILHGHSGAGKTTLLRLIPAIERPTCGKVVVHGQDVSAMKRRAVPFLRRNMGLVFQEQKLLHDRSVFDNVMLPLAITGYPPGDAARRVRAALDRVGLMDRERAMPVTLSGGEQQRLAIARAIVNRPALLVADEPTVFLDEDHARSIVELLLSFNRVGVTVLIATHDEKMFAGVPARRLELRQGRLLT